MAENRELLDRTKSYALRVIRLFVALPKTEVARVLGKQLLRSGTSAGSPYREAQRAKSGADFISKVEGALQELEESRYWLEPLSGAGVLTPRKCEALIDETAELIAIFTVIAKRAKGI